MEDFVQSEIQSSYKAWELCTNCEVVVYEGDRYKNFLCSKCKCFTDEDVMFIPFDDCGINIKQFTKIFKDQVSEVLITDQQVHQIDRHGGNFGI